MGILGEVQGATVTAQMWARPEDVEAGALEQLRNVASLPWVRHVCAMPDIHFGFGPPVGSVVAMKDAVSPYAVGVDIGCGMAAVKTSLRAEHLPDSLSVLRSEIEARVPVGNGPGGSRAEAAASDLFAEFGSLAVAETEVERIARLQVGTLGGGNHFIEVSLDTEGGVWIVLHSGSRNIGKRVAEWHVKIAKVMEHNAKLPDPNLAVLLNGTPEMATYRRDLYWAQRYAMANRETMLRDVMEAVALLAPNVTFDEPVRCHHNYVAEETHHGEHLFVTRKGAIRAGAGELGIIPGSMGTRSYIVRGRGSAASLCSASHGAGRRMSRGQAKRTFTVADLAEQTAGVDCRKDAGVLDEIPGAYKDIDAVMANQADLVEIVATLKAVLCVKG